MSGEFTHFDEKGNAVMVDVSSKDDSIRTALAKASVLMSETCFTALKNGQVTKGDVLGVARVAGIMAAKKTSDIIPMCHPLMLTKCTVDFQLKDNKVYIEAFVKTTGKTGVEMEALTAASSAALTIYDMCKAIDKKMIIENIYLAEKTGGKSGKFVHKP
ncbi:cyclic pyranopterin monophosphate synthase MoaC [Fusibacter sp. JL216-2]|uniref:cyclic pyranopterin monophosphate synthase MoaC n=1 Tax=Fusibacter sp. JL216-2 TaxID=3071453 RepID=UPI003D3258D0